MTGRIGYQTSPAFTPYVEGGSREAVFMTRRPTAMATSVNSTIAGVSVRY